MSNYHITIATERRTQPERMAQQISTSKPSGNVINDMPEYVIDRTQLHTHTGANLHKEVDGEQVLDFSNPQFVMVAEWDLKSPYVIQHKGDYASVTMRYSGWPEITKEQFDALPKPDPLV